MTDFNHENIITGVIKEASIYFGNIEKAASDTNGKFVRTKDMLHDIADELSQAFINKGVENDFGKLTENALLLCQEIDSLDKAVQGSIKDSSMLMTDGMINVSMLLCKNQGVYPHFTTKLAAAALYYYAQIQNNEIYNKILTNGLKAAIKEVCGLDNEPELAHLIWEAYKTILSGEFFNIDRKRLKIVKSAFEVAFKNEAMYGGCPQCLIKSFLTICNKNDEKSKHMFKSASALSGGIACCNDSACGAYTGAMMVIGSCVGREIKDLDDENGETGARGNDIGRIVHDKFMDTYGTLICKEIHMNKFGREFNFRHAAHLVEFREAGAHEDKCPMVVGIANSWVCGALYDEGLLANL